MKLELTEWEVLLILNDKDEQIRLLKASCDAVARDLEVAKAQTPRSSYGMNPEEIRLFLDEIMWPDNSGKIPAIKRIRAATGFGLKESKDLVEAIAERIR